LLPKRLREWGFRRITGRLKGSTIAERGGVRFHLELDEVIDVGILMGTFEPDVTAVLARLCRPGMTVLDIGANIGAHALPLAKAVGASGRVVAFEPTEFAFRKLERNLALNDLPQLEIHRVALGSENAHQRKIDYRSSWRTDGGQSSSSCLVDFQRLDDFAETHSIRRVDLIKLDVDGNEYSILAGGIEVLKRSRPAIVLEVVGPHFADPETNPIRLLHELGYGFSSVEGEEYGSWPEVGGGLDPQDAGLTTSRNIVAQCAARGAAV